MLFVLLNFFILVFSSKSKRENIHIAEYSDCTASLIDDLLSIEKTGLPTYNAFDEKCEFQDAVDWEILYDFNDQNIFENESYGNQWRERSFKAGFQM